MSWRPTLIQLMATVILLALALAMMKAASEGLARGVVLLTTWTLLIATLGAIVRRRRRAAWTGFALFGWGYILIAAGGPYLDFFSSSNIEMDIWRVDVATQAIANRFHPKPVEPADPFPNDSIVQDPATGVRSKVRNNQSTPMTPDEVTLQVDYEARSKFYTDRTRDARHSRAIGLAIQGAAFAVIGAIVGLALSDQPNEAVSAAAVESSTLAD